MYSQFFDRIFLLIAFVSFSAINRTVTANNTTTLLSEYQPSRGSLLS